MTKKEILKFRMFNHGGRSEAGAQVFLMGKLLRIQLTGQIQPTVSQWKWKVKFLQVKMRFIQAYPKILIPLRQTIMMNLGELSGVGVPQYHTEIDFGSAGIQSEEAN